MNSMMRRVLLALAVLVIALIGAIPVRSATVLPMYLDELIDRSAVAFEGTCTANRTERDPATGLVVTYTTFDVRDGLKGAVGSTHEIKQIGGTLPDESVQFSVKGIPSFEVGEDYVVFLAGVSSAGFSSPMGLSQGRFGVKAEGATRRVGNGRDFRDMAARMLARVPERARIRLQQSEAPVRELELGEFKEAVRAHLGGAK